MDELKYLGENVYMAYGKVLLVGDPSIDPDTDEGRQEILSCMKGMFEDKFDPRPWGVLSAGEMLPMVLCRDGKYRHMWSCRHFSTLPEAVKAQLRKEFQEYASEI